MYSWVKGSDKNLERKELVLNEEVKKFKQKAFIRAIVVTLFSSVFFVPGIFCIINTFGNGTLVWLLGVLCVLVSSVVMLIYWTKATLYMGCTYNIVNRVCDGKETSKDNSKSNRSYYLIFNENDVEVSKKTYEDVSKGDKCYLLLIVGKNEICGVYSQKEFEYRNIL